jgi:beta-hydroxylase
MIFDDTYEHEAWNDTDGTRVVLFVDFVRPLRSPARWLNAAVLWAIAFSPFIGDAKRRHNDWEKRFEEMKERRAAAAAR